MRDLRSRIDSGIILITHDMGVVADMADSIVVMRRGKVVEHGTADDIFNRPQHPYTRELLGAVPHLGGKSAVQVSEPAPEAAAAPGVKEEAAPTPGAGEEATGLAGAPVMVAENMVIEYPKHGRVPAFRAVDQVDLTIDAGEVVGLVGESGSGKTTIGRAVVGRSEERRV